MKIAIVRGLSLAFVLAFVVSFLGCATGSGVEADPALRPSSGNAETAAATSSESTSADSRVRLSLAYPTGDEATSTILLERYSPREVLADTGFQYEIRVTNLTGLEVTEVVVNDRIPESLRIDKSEPELRKTAAGAQWALGSIPAKEHKTVRVTATSLETGTVRSDTTVSYSMSLSSLVDVIHPDLSLTMKLPREVLIGDTFPMTVTVANRGVGTAQNVRVTYVPPDGFSIVDGETSWDIGTLEPGTPRELPALTVRASRAGSHTHNASARAQMANGILDAMSTPVSVNVLQPKLDVVASGPQGRTAIGRPFQYDITITNSGDGLVRNPVYKHPVPEGLVVVEVSDGGTLEGGVVTWNLGDLSPKASKKVYVRLVGDEARDVVFATGELHEIGQALTSFSGSKQVPIVGFPKLDVDVRRESDPIVVGNDEKYTVTVKNEGTAPLTNIKVVCKLDEKVSYVGSSSPGPGRGTRSGNTVVFDPLAMLEPDPGKVTSWEVTAKTLEAGVVSFTAKVTCDEFPQGAGEKTVMVNVIR